MKLQQSGVLDVVNRNRHIMKPNSDIVDDALVNLCENIRDTGAVQDAVVLQNEYQKQSVGQIAIPDEELNFKIKMLNQK